MFNKKRVQFIITFSLILVFYGTLSCVSREQSDQRTEESREEAQAAEERARGILSAAEKEREVGKAVFAKLAGKYGILKDEETTSYLNKLGQSLALFSGRQEIQYYFAILDTDQINGYALPGGYILLSRGAIAQMDSPGALIGVLSHELGHINLKHVLNSVEIEVEYGVFEMLARIIAGPRQIVSVVVSEASDKIEETLFMEGLAVDDEYAADQYAVTLMQSLGLSADGYLEYLMLLKDDTGVSELETLDKTHPPLSERIERIQAAMAEGLQEPEETVEYQNFMTGIRELASSRKEEEL